MLNITTNNVVTQIYKLNVFHQLHWNVHDLEKKNACKIARVTSIWAMVTSKATNSNMSAPIPCKANE